MHVYSKPRLVTFPISHFCERARWALQIANVDFSEVEVAPLFHRHLAGGSVPALILPNGTRVKGSLNIVNWASEQSTTERFVMSQIMEEKLQNFGAPVRRLIYFYVLSHKPLALHLLCPNTVPQYQRFVVKQMYPVLVYMMRKAMKINEEGSMRARKHISEMFLWAEQRLKDHPYLLGNVFSSVDIAFCSLASPLVLPPQIELYQQAYQSFKDYEPIRTLVQEYRDSPAGQYVLQIYATKRGTPHRDASNG